MVVSLVAAIAGWNSRRCLVLAAGSAVLLVWLPWLHSRHGNLELHMIDVGQGDAIALRTPSGHWVLFDAGGAWTSGDAGKSTVVPYLARCGGDLTTFILSHPHTDHVGGAASVLSALHPSLYLDAAFAAGNDAYRSSLRVAAERRVSWHRVHPGDSIVVDGVVLSLLAPDSVWTSGLADPNLASTIVVARYGIRRFLFTGDAEAPEERWVLEHWGSALRADVLKVAHHGSATSSTPEFLDAVRPRIALVSVGAGNMYGHPSAAVLRTLAAHGARVLRTDVLGTIVVSTDGQALWVEADGEKWEVP
jgi:competence protein ComEC